MSDTPDDQQPPLSGHDVFISYKRADASSVARWLRRRLVFYKAPGTLGPLASKRIDVFLDEIYETATSDFFDRKIVPNLSSSRWLIVLCTPAAFEPRSDGSPSWVVRELTIFMSLPQGANVIPVLVRADSAIPPVILTPFPNIEYVDLRDYSTTPWWSLRRRQRLDEELVKIAAPLIGVRDEQMPLLRREESRRKQRRAWTLAALSLLALMLMSIVSGVALNSLRQATAQLTRNHTSRAEELFSANPAAAQLHLARAVRTAEASWLPFANVPAEASLARLWLGTIRAHPAPLVLFQGSAVTASAMSRDNLLHATGTRDGWVRTWNVATGVRISEYPLGGAVESVAFSPDATLVAAGGRGNCARVWRLASSQRVGQPIVHKDYVMGVAFDSVGRLIATAAADGTLRITQLGDWASRDLAPGHSSSAHRLSFSPDGARLLTSSADGTAQLWDVATATRLGRGMTLTDTYVADFSADGRFVSTSNPVRVWDGRNGEPLGAPIEHAGTLMAAFSPDATRIATANRDTTARVWDRQTGAPIGKIMRHPAAVRLVAWSDGGYLLATADESSVIRVWAAETGELLDAPVQHAGGVTFLRFGRSDTLITAGEDGTAFVIDLRGIRTTPWTLSALSTAIVHVPSSVATLVTGSADGAIRFFDPGTRQPRRAPLMQGSAVSQIAVTSDGRRLATMSAYSGDLDTAWTAQLWDLTTSRRIGEVMKPAQRVHAVEFTPDGSWLLLRGDDTVYFADANTGELRANVLRQKSAITHVAASRVGRQIVTTSSDWIARVWDYSGQLVRELSHESAVLHASFSDDGRYLATATSAYENVGRIWNVSDGTLACSLLPHTGNVVSIRFDRYGRRVVTASADGTAQVWDVSSGARVGTPLVHAQPLTDAVFSPDGALVLTTSYDGTARLWSAESGEPAGPIMEQGPRFVPGVMNYSIGVTQGRFSPDGSLIATTSADGAVRVWRVMPVDESWDRLELRAEVATVSTLDASTSAIRRLTGDEWHARRVRLAAMPRVNSPVR